MHRTGRPKGYPARNSVTTERIVERLNEFGAAFISREFKQLTGGSGTSVTFRCAGREGFVCDRILTRNWNDIQSPRRSPRCKSCAQPRLRGVDSPGYNHQHPRRADEDRRWRAADREWAAAVLARDNYTCQISGQRGGRLAAHHLNSRTHFPEQKYLLPNGITLTEELHAEYHNIRGNKRRPTRETFANFYFLKTGRPFPCPITKSKRNP